MKIGTIHAAKTNLSRLIQDALDGKQVIIARGRTPVARPVPVSTPAPARKFGAMRGHARVTAAFFEPLPPGELDLWE
jgi:antitoxin (DNA-binding transcriptional repressor) of toxin-antitoxin stability system